MLVIVMLGFIKFMIEVADTDSLPLLWFELFVKQCLLLCIACMVSVLVCPSLRKVHCYHVLSFVSKGIVSAISSCMESRHKMFKHVITLLATCSFSLKC